MHLRCLVFLHHLHHFIYFSLLQVFLAQCSRHSELLGSVFSLNQHALFALKFLLFHPAANDANKLRRLNWIQHVMLLKMTVNECLRVRSLHVKIAAPPPRMQSRALCDVTSQFFFYSFHFFATARQIEEAQCRARGEAGGSRDPNQRPID